MRCLGFLGALTLVASLGAQAPVVLATIDGPTSPEQMASQNGLAGLGDVNGDGAPDFIVGSPSWPAPHPTIVGATVAQVGKARVISGATLQPLFEITGTTNLQALGRSVANVGDLDGDGRNDVAVGAPMFGPTVPGAVPPPPQVQVWSTGTASPLFTLTSGAGGFASSNFGFSVAGAGDLGQVSGGLFVAIPDGVPDLIVGASTGNAAAVYSGAGGALMFVMDASTVNPPLPAAPYLAANEDFGGAVAGGHDVNADGIPDLLVAARLSTLGGTLPTSTSVQQAGAVFVLSGAGGAVIALILGGPGDGLGQSVAFIDDADGDGVTDFAIGATRTDVGATDSGSVTLYSGATRAPLWTTSGLVAADAFGYAVVGAGDFNGDGVSEVLVGTPTTDIGASNTGSVTLLDGASGTRFESLHGLLATDLLGRSIGFFGDGDNDGYPELLAGAPVADVGGSSTGTVSIVSFGPHLGACAAGTVPNGSGGQADVLRISGSSGASPRRVDVPVGAPFSIDFTPGPLASAPSPSYLILCIGVPLAADQTSLPGIGTLCFPAPILSPADPRLFLFSNSFVPLDPSALIATTPAAASSLPIASGLSSPVRVTLGGVTLAGSQLRIANSVLLNVR